MKKKLSDKWFWFWFILIIFIAFNMRVIQLSTRPLHHDEGVFEFYFLEPLTRNEALVYLGMEYKGLAPFFLSYPFLKIFGLSIFSIRLAPAFYGTLTVFLLYFLKDYIGKKGVLFSAAFLAVSPTFVYYSRQWTSYPFFVCFLLLFIIVGLRFLKEFKPSQLYWIFALTAIILNMNEIFVIFLFILGSFFYLTYLFDEKCFKKKLKLFRKIKWFHFVLGILLFAVVVIIIHTSFLYMWSNLTAIINLPSELTDKIISTGHNKSFPYFFTILVPLEVGLLLISLVGLIYFKRDKFSYFIIFWSLAFLFMFSLMSYKTNWMLTVVIFPLILLAGSTVDYLIERFKPGIIIPIVILLILVNLYFSIHQNYLFVNNFEKNKMGYVETSTDINWLVSDIKNYASGGNVSILITANSYWPIPSYLRGYNISYLTEIDKIDFDKYSYYDVFISDKKQAPSIPKSFTEREYELRRYYNIVGLYKTVIEDIE